jgi:hypothetical protein
VRPLLLLVVGVAMMACRPSKGDADVGEGTLTDTVAGHSAAKPRAVDLAQPLLSLTRGPCYGRCPEYTVSLYGDGRVEYRGTAAVAVMGAASGRADSAAVWAAYEALLADGASAADTLYGVDHPACQPYIPDTPVITLGVQVDRTVHRIQFDAGCAGAPSYLRRASEQIDRVAAVDGWVRANIQKARAP